MEIIEKEYIDKVTGVVVKKRTIRGRAVYNHPRRGEIVADEMTTLDYGEQGTTRIYVHYPDITPEENQRRIDECRRLAGMIYRDMLARKMIEEENAV